MFRPVGLLAVGVVGVVLAKLLWGFIALPVLGFLLGALFFFLKIVLIVGLVWLGWQLFRKLTDRPSEA